MSFFKRLHDGCGCLDGRCGPNNLLLRGVVADQGGLNLRTCYLYDTYGRRISETQPAAAVAACP